MNAHDLLNELQNEKTHYEVKRKEIARMIYEEMMAVKTRWDNHPNIDINLFWDETIQVDEEIYQFEFEDDENGSE